MNAQTLVAEANALDREADAIWEKIDVARQVQGPDALGYFAVVPDGSRGDAQRAGELAREARYLRAEAAEITAAAEHVPAEQPLPNSTAPVSPCSPMRPLAGAVETVESVALRILASDGLPQDKDVERAPKRIKKGDGPAHVEDVARRILNA